MPGLQRRGNGREDNHESFKSFLTGSSVREGYSFRLSAVFGFKSAVEAITVYDFNASMLHLISLYHERLTLNHNGLDRRLTSAHEGDIKQVMA
ncbi:MAG TPA: hypothetical protein DIT98_01985 [Verrucomicrobiales bacterium]|nr:hypothetical protein [Verrucomicrobiales bacterium]